MRKLKSLLPAWHPSASGSLPATKALPNETQPLPASQERDIRQPCGPKCWLKGFLDYSKDVPTHARPALLEATPATDEQRLEIAQQLYSPIWAWQTRLLKIYPGEISDITCCDLLVVDLIATPGVGATNTGEIIEYEALSYSWGYPAFTHRVECNGVEVPVTEGLAQALLHLRLPDRSRYLWVDAFCINQFDAREKSRQVRNMLLIYQKSTGVMAWLGNPENNDDVILNFLDKIATSDTPLRSDEHIYHDEICAKRYSHVSTDLHSFYSKPWFARTWIRQEVFASKSLTLVCGNCTWNNGIFRAIDVWQQFQPTPTPESSLVARSIPNQDTLEAMRQSRIATKRWLSSRVKLAAPIRQLVHTGVWLEGILAGVRFGVTDPRDKIYAIIGMLEEKSVLLDLEAPHSEDTQQRATFTASINYDKSISEVYQDITKFLVNRDRNLLPLCVFRDRTVAADGLPGWAISCNPGSRSWYIATHLSADSEPALLLQQHFMQGLYGGAERIDPEADGTMRITGCRICTLRSYTAGEKSSGRLPTDRSLVTSPPLPDKGFFHTFIKSYEMLLKECAYQELGIQWLHHIDELIDKSSGLVPGDLEHSLQARLPRSALVSQAAGPAAFLVLVDGSPLPLVLQKADQNTSQYLYLGPAAWAVGNAGPDGAPGYEVTMLLRSIAQKQSWKKEEFLLV